jgi:DNA-binding winged helix-turn-helix (wHTH) protein
MGIFFKVIFFIIFNMVCAHQSYAQQLKYEAEALLDLTAIEYKSLVNNEDYGPIDFKVAVSPLILGTVIWNSAEELVFPRKDNWVPISQNIVNNEIYRMRSLLESAELTAWEKRTVDGSSLLYCRKDTVSFCFLVDTEVLAQRLGQDKQDVLNDVLNNQSQQAYFMSLFLFFLVMSISVWLGWQHFISRDKQVYNQQGAINKENSDSLKIAKLTLNPSKLTIQNKDAIIHVGDKDMKLLVLFAMRPDEVISKEELYVAVWQRPFLSTSRALDQHMMLLRRKINIDLSNSNVIDIVHGQGYRYNFVKN